MTARDMLDLATLVVANARAIVHGPGSIAASGIEQYWTASKCRLDRWARALKQLNSTLGQSNAAQQHSTSHAVLEEVFVGEVLTRVCNGVLCAHDELRDTQSAAPIARSVFIGHLEARHRALRLLLRAAGSAAAWTTEVDRIRRRAERWTDLLIAHMLGACDGTEFAFDADRTLALAGQLRERDNGAVSDGHLLLASLRCAFRDVRLHPSPNADLQSRIAASILHWFPESMFDGAGVPVGPNIVRLLDAARDSTRPPSATDTREACPAPATSGDVPHMLDRRRHFS